MIESHVEGPPQEIPFDAPHPPDHYLHGAATAVVRYGFAFIVARYGTHTEHLTWRAGRWVFKPYPAPRPLYGAELLVKRPHEPVLIVDTEAAADLARRLLPAYVVVSWAGGPPRLMENDWSGLKGRDVLLWPNAREFHVKLVEYILLVATRVRIVDARDEPPGWHVGDVYEASISASEVAAWATKRLKDPSAYRPPLAAAARSELLEPALWDALRARGWDELNLDVNRDGTPYPTVANCARLLRAAGKLLQFDEFTGRVLVPVAGKERPWSAQDSNDLAVLMQDHLRLPKFDEVLTAKSVLYAARRNSVHTLRRWLERLTWDRTERLAHWLADILGVEKTPYTETVAKNWLTAMVARAFEPERTMPFMLVLEGGHPGLCTEALMRLSDPWFTSATLIDVERKIPGAWLIEMTPMQRLSHRQSDLLGSLVVSPQARSALFAAQAGDDTYVTGSHVWGVPVSGVDLVALRLQREQLFAEAVVAYRSGVSFLDAPARYPDKELDPLAGDDWTPAVLDYAKRVWAESERTHVRIDITTARILKEALHIPTWQHENRYKFRVCGILRANGWVQKRDKSRHWRPVIRYLRK